VSLYLNAVVVGIVAGGVYSLVGISISLMFRSTGVLSIAHAAFAAVGAYLYSDLAGQRHWPRGLAVIVALAITIAYGLAVERVAIRPVRSASSTTKLIVTLGVLSGTTGLLLTVYGFEPTSSPLLLPDRAVRLGDLAISYQQLAVFVLAGGAALALGWFLRRTRLGTAVRAVAQNADAARLMGVSLKQVARFNWAIGAGLAGITGILIAPLAPVTAATFPLVLVKALTGTLLGGLVSLPLTFAGGLLVGVVESVAVIESSAAGAQEVAVLVVVVVMLFARRSWPTDLVASAESRAPSRLAALRSKVTDRVRSHRLLRPARYAARGIAALVVTVAILGVVTTVGNEYWGFVYARSLFYVLEALSLVLLVGWGGQVSLMHGAYVGIGAFATGYLVVDQGWPLEPAILVAACLGTAIGAVAGIPALRLSGLQFAIASLAFAAFASSYLFRLDALRFSRFLDRRQLLGVDLFNTYSLFVVMLPVTAVCYVAVWRVRRSTYGALLLASRDAPSTVAHFGADPRRARMAAFALASFIATLGGSFYGILLTAFRPEDFGFQLSLMLLLYAVIGGVESLAGPIVAGVAFGIVPELFAGEASTTASSLPDIVSGVVVIVLMAARPAGVASLLRRRTRALDVEVSLRPRWRFGRWAPIVDGQSVTPPLREPAADQDPTVPATASVPA
jgi:branched-subunit amino acid ABC-type transport system permease component